MTPGVVIYVTYPGDADSRFDRDYYVHKHLPLVMKAWQAYGLESVAAFFPAVKQLGTIAICECRFHDEAAVHDAFASPEAAAVMADVAHFTDIEPQRVRAVSI